MYNYDKLLMGNEVAAVDFLSKHCDMKKSDALKFIGKYRQKKEYELLALSMETDVVCVEKELEEMNEFINVKSLK